MLLMGCWQLGAVPHRMDNVGPEPYKGLELISEGGSSLSCPTVADNWVATPATWYCIVTIYMYIIYTFLLIQCSMGGTLAALSGSTFGQQVHVDTSSSFMHTLSHVCISHLPCLLIVRY